jgi:hypothetical protein
MFFFFLSFFLFSFLSPPLKIHVDHSISKLFSYLLRFQLWSLFFWFLIFVLNLFVKFWFVFNFIPQSQFIICYFFQFGPHFFLLLNWFFFSISPFNLFFLLFSFNFDLHFFSCYFYFESFCIIDFFFNFIIQYLIGWELDFMVFVDKVLPV